jgi:predicted dehydrogenase
MSTRTVLLAGTVGAGTQHHQAHMWLPALLKAGLVPEAVWMPPGADDAAMERARSLAVSHDLELRVTETPETSAAGAIVCLRGADRAAFAEFAAGRGLPILLDKPTLDTTSELEEFAAAAGSLPVLAGHHLLSHPGFTRILTGVRNAEIGLLRAVHADMVTGGGEAQDDELRNLGVHLIDAIRQLTGPATVRLQAHGGTDGGPWTMLGKTDKGVVVSHHISRASAGAPTVRQLRINLRLVGTHGFIEADLTKPALELRTVDASTARPFTPGSAAGHVQRFAAVIRGEARTPPASDFVTLSRALDGMAASAASGEATSISW